MKFYGISGELYTVEASRLGIRCDVVIELYDVDGTTMVASKDTIGDPQADEVLEWSCAADGVYFVRIRHYDPGTFCEDTEYDLDVYNPIGPFPGFIDGTVSDFFSGASIGEARIKTSRSMSSLSLSSGAYLMVHPAGTFTLTAHADGYRAFTDTVTVVALETTTVDITLVPSLVKGDVNGDGRVDLADAVSVLQVMSQTAGFLEGVSRDADVNGDARIGIPEAVYVLLAVSEPVQ